MVVDFQVKSLDFIRNQVSYVLRPLENIMLLPSDLFSFGEDYFTSRSSLVKENLSLKTRQTELSLLANQAALLAVENQNLRNLLELQKNTSFRTVPVKILFNPPNPISQRVVINRGSNHGLNLGSPIANDAGILGLLNQTAVASDTTTITTPIANMTAAQLQTLLKNMFAVYFANSNNTQTKPDTFAIATKDWLGMATAASDPTYAGMGLSKASYLQQQFREITQNPDAKIVPLLYCDKSVSKLANNRYVLYKRDNEVMEMNIPVSYTSTVAGSYNNFQFQSVAYGQYTGLQLFRPKEVLYFDFSGTI
jgi:hypothetical protein